MNPENAPGGERALQDGREQQFRLARIQTFNWGTFAGVTDVPIPEAGFLFVGPSGSGKSTLLDAHAALLTPPKWVDFNVAAREAERAGKDRSVMSYLRGAWAQQTGDNGEYAVQYLRTGTTWSVVAETYRNAEGRAVTIALVVFVRGKSLATTDVKRVHLVLPRELDVADLEFFAKSDFDIRRFKHDLPDAFVRDEFSAYQERFRSLLGIESERALRLLHKTQSAKNLGDLNVFLRDFMLDPPETFAVAERLVSEFGELNAAHQAVVAARRQIETLAPARAWHAELLQCGYEKGALDELAAGVDAYSEQEREELLSRRMAALAVEAEGARQEAQRLDLLADDEARKLDDLTRKRAGFGSALAQLERDLAAAKGDLPLRATKRERMLAACAALGIASPESPALFVQAVATAKARLERAGEMSTELEARKDKLKDRRREAETEFGSVCAEVAAMARQRSNIPAHMLAARAQIADGLGIAEERLPFVGELLEVKAEAASWQGALERVLHGFALSLILGDGIYAAFSTYVNEHVTGQRIVYYRMLPHERRRSAGPSSLVRKLEIRQIPEADWLRDELTERFDYECAETMHAFRNAVRAVTEKGQVKHSQSRHEKDDRFRVDDRRRWVLGFDNREKRALYEALAAKLGAEIAALADALGGLQLEERRQRDELLHSQVLSNLTWVEVDVTSLAAHIAGLEREIDAERSARPELVSLDKRIAAQEKALKVARGAADDQRLAERSAEKERAKHARALEELSPQLLETTLTPAQHAGLTERFARASKAMALESLDGITKEIDRRLREESKERELRMVKLRNDIEGSFKAFNQSWPAESGGLDPSVASANDYLAKLARLETDGLPRYEERFLQLLHEQSDQNLTLLSTRIDIERAAIRERLELVNESLSTAAFNPGTHLVIDPLDRPLEEVRRFKQGLKEALSQSFSSEREIVEKRFVALNALVKRLSSQETVDKSWRNLVLDVRQHVEFVARELDASGSEVEIYRSGAGKSGGQRQKLAATCLAAALRYQLGGPDRAMPPFGTVVLDEAFDKADAEFTTMAMNIFTTFGFHMIVATPLKSVMTLEPFIGGAGFVHIKDRKSSSILMIEYDADAKRLKLPSKDPAARGEIVANESPLS